MQRYNIALVPVQTAIRERLIQISQDFFGSIHDHYILGEEGIPHVTLCQFYAESLDHAQTISRSYLMTEPAIPLIEIESFQIRSGSLINAGKFIAEYYVRKDEALMQMQKDCADFLAEHGIENQTPCDRYAPHFTLARLSAPCDIIPSVQDAPQGPYEMGLRLGLTSETGVFVKDVSAF